jgi:triphosphoribosyl-dephospho-CoA synthase
MGWKLSTEQLDEHRLVGFRICEIIDLAPSSQNPAAIGKIVMPSELLSIRDHDLAERDAHGRARLLANSAFRALIAEAELTPKPALVDERGPGAHTDLSLALMSRSARSLRGYFEQMALVSFRRPPSQRLREELGAIGRSAERSMLASTEGVNTHRGAIWALGLLVSAAAMGSNSPKMIAHRAGQLARIPDRKAPIKESNGLSVMRRYHISGARGEARAGFPNVITVALPMLYRSRCQGRSETVARLDALLAIITSLNDTCLLYRGGWKAHRTAQYGATAVLAAGGSDTVRGWELLQLLDRRLVALNASPGGSADLLASTLFLDFIALAGQQKGHHGKAKF